MKTKSLLAAMLLTVCGTAYAQTTMKITFKNAEQEVVTYNVEDIQDVTWEVTQATDERAVDLGLPSGTLWADQNVGYTTENPYGNYYAWGEVKPNKTSYTWGNYTLSDGSYNTITRYVTDDTFGEEVDNLTALLPEDDGAVQDPEWGAHWRIPTAEQFQELLDNCTWAYETDAAKVKWVVLTSKNNGAQIKFPGSGYFDGAKVQQKGMTAFIWLQELNVDYNSQAYEGVFATSSVFASSSFKVYPSGQRYFGQAIRPVFVP